MPLSEDDKAVAQNLIEGLRQGDLIDTPVAVVLEAPESSNVDDAQTLQTVDHDEIWAPAALSIDSGWTAIVTQTCDIVRDLNDVEYVQVMPVVKLDEAEWKSAQDGRRGTLFALPPNADAELNYPAIDCAISFPVAKAAFAHAKVLTFASPLDPAGRVLLSHWLMRRVGRHPFPDELEKHVLQPLRVKVANSIGKSSQAGFLVSGLVGVWSSTDWSAAVSIIFVVDQNRLDALGVSVDVGKGAEELIAPVRKRLGKEDISVQLTTSVRTFDSVSAAELLLRHRQIDIDAMPTGNYQARATIDADEVAS